MSTQRSRAATEVLNDVEALNGSKAMPLGSSKDESQRDSGLEPRVARDELPWVTASEVNNPNGVASRREHRAATPLGLRFFPAATQGSSFLATLGWRTQSLWDCRSARSAARLSASCNIRKAWGLNVVCARARCSRMLRKFSRLGLVAAWVAALGVLPLGAQELRIGEHAVLPGGLVSVPVLVSNAAGLSSASLTINYDPEILSLEGITNGGLGQTFAIEHGTSEGQVRVAAVSDNALAGGSGALVVLSFRANAGAAPGMASPIALADRRLGGQYGRDLAWSGTVTHTNGNVRVVSATDDQDANGLPDWWEEWYFGSPTGADPAADADGDGMTNAAEFMAGTDPLDANSRLAVTAMSAGPGGFSMTFPTVVGKVYAVEYSESLAAWSVLTSGIAGTGGDIQFNDSSTSGAAQRFYRVQVE
jgi:hypothetical protein